MNVLNSELLEVFALLNERESINTVQDAKNRANQNGWTLVEKKTNPPNINDIRVEVKNIITNTFNIKENIDEAADVLMGQLYMETGFKSQHNNNVGNLKASGSANQFWKGKVITLLAHENKKNSEKYYMYSLFKAYDTLRDGVGDWARLLKSKYPLAVAAASRGDVVGFVNELKTVGYFTAPTKDYLAGAMLKDAKAALAKATKEKE